ncbi:spermatogenesis-associated protein 22 [Parambassis ranga]|uniref:Spermatogenesis-associated protein 22 n=1 Tax=Parambassis ranga TaxID=210632 RepID=A0A6P7JM43_9TELE|nr:spermatogenesis-associated protein 22 [Parambassis ranga]
MSRQENQPPRPTSGSISVPLFNQRKRNRVPLTCVPSDNEFFSSIECMASNSSNVSYSKSGTFGSYPASGPSAGAPHSDQWNREGIQQSAPSQQYSGYRPISGPAFHMKSYRPMPHPYKAGNTSSAMGQSSNSVREQASSSSVTSRANKYQTSWSSESAQSKPTPSTGFSQMVQQSSQRLAISTHQYAQQSRPPPPPPPPAAAAPPRRPSSDAVQQKNNSWKFTNSFEPQGSTFEGKGLTQPKTRQPTQTQQETDPGKPSIKNSLRILTAVIDGMRYWSQFKDKVPYLFEIFATLDSAVTLGCYGAKNFLMRDGKEVVQCVFFDNEQVLPRLIRGQVHRCVGNYDPSRDVLMCVSVRSALPSELRNAQEAVKVCDAEMRALVKSLSEV